MSVDMKIELFACDLFRYLWCKSNLVVSVLPRMACYGNEESECSHAVVHAVYCRQRLFRQKLAQNIARDYCTYSRCGIDFYLYLRNNIDVYIPYPEMSIFDKMFTTCAVVLEMAYWCATNENKMYMFHAPLCWAMFFDTEMKEEFYAEGGWENLEMYASSYDTKVLSETFLAEFCVHPDDHLNAQELLKACNDDYNLSDLFEKFKQRCYERKSEDKVSCSKCHPLFITLNEAVFPSGTVAEQSKLVEGYLQIFLCMMTYGEMEEIEANVLESMKDKNIDALESTEHLDCDQPESTPCSKKEKLKSLATVELIDRLFADDINYNPDGQDWCDENVSCIFCGENINQPVKSIQNDKQANQIEQIKSAICQTLEETRFKIPAVPEIKCSSGVKEPQAHGKMTVPKTIMKKHSKTDVDSSNERNNSDVKDALKMFLTLGIEPAKTSMLAAIKDSARDRLKVEETENDNLQNENEDSRQVVPEETPAEKGSKKKKKKKKNKNKNSKVSETS